MLPLPVPPKPPRIAQLVLAEMRNRVDLKQRDTARFEFSPGTTRATATVPVSIAWNLNPQMSKGVELYAYFDAPNRALADMSGNRIPSSRLSAAFADGPLRSFAQTDSALRIFGQTVGTEDLRHTVENSIHLQLDLADGPPPAGTYTGVLHLQARVF